VRSVPMVMSRYEWAGLHFNNPLKREVERCWPWIEAAMQKGMPGGVITHNLDDVSAMVINGDAQLWSTPDGCMLTYVSAFPRAKIVQVWTLGGDFDQVMLQHEQAVIEWATSIGAVLLYVQGRKGWTRKLADRGWKESQRIMTLELNNGKHGGAERSTISATSSTTPTELASAGG